MITGEKYIEYLICTPFNYTCTDLSGHAGDISHDSVGDFLKKQRITPRRLWNEVKDVLHGSDESCLIIDDSVRNRQYSGSIELVKLQYSGAAGGTVRGIGVVDPVHTDGRECCPIDYRIYSEETDGKTKNNHFREMLINAVGDKGLRAERVLFDSRYSARDNLKLVDTPGLFFYTTLKSDRLVSLSREEGRIHPDEINRTAERLRSGVTVKLKKVPFKVKLFRPVARNGGIDRLITDEPDETPTAQVVKEIKD
ncbi:MAG: transposase [FCB group bacterium]|nr:transposase [FCB group bacterium]